MNSIAQKNRHSRSRRATQTLTALLLCLCLFFCTAAAEGETLPEIDLGSTESGEGSGEKSSDPVDVPLLPFTDGVLTEEKTYVLIQCSSTLNVRARATTDSEVVAYISDSAWCVRLGQETDSTGRTWYRVDTGAAAGSWDGTGYVSGNYSQCFTVAAGEDAYPAYLTALGFPESYLESLSAMHARYPSWIFLPAQTADCWAEALYQEANPASYRGISLVRINTRSSWKATKGGAYDWTTSSWSTSYDGAGWTLASDEIVAYYLDPRNFLSDTSSIFMFLDQSFDASQTVEGVSSILQGTFMEAASTTDADGTVFNYAEVIYQAGKDVGVSPYFLAASIRQEQGVYGTSKSITGTSSKFPGYYNYFNVYANTTAEYDANDHGLWFACGQLTPAQVAAGQTSSITSYNRPWNTRQKSILGGTMYLGNNYILKGQNTLYLKRFNVLAGSGFSQYRHQFMTNIQGAYAEAVELSRAYSETARQEVLTFSIPVYENMPEERSPLPTGDGSPNNRLKSLSVEGQELLPAFDMNTLSYSLEPEEPVTSLTVSAEAYDSTATIDGTGQLSLQPGSNTLEITVTAENGDVRTYTITVESEQGGTQPTQESTEESTEASTEESTEASTEESTEASTEESTEASTEESTEESTEPSVSGTEESTEDESSCGEDPAPAASPEFTLREDGSMTGITPGMKLEEFLEKLHLAEGASVQVREASGSEKAAGALMKTGDTLVVKDAGGSSFLEATVLIYGDVNGDGAVKVSDMIKIRNHILEITKLSGVYAQAADVNRDGNVKVSDMIKIRNHILGITALSQ